MLALHATRGVCAGSPLLASSSAASAKHHPAAARRYKPHQQFIGEFLREYEDPEVRPQRHVLDGAGVVGNVAYSFVERRTYQCRIDA